MPNAEEYEQVIEGIETTIDSLRVAQRSLITADLDDTYRRLHVARSALALLTEAMRRVFNDRDCKLCQHKLATHRDGPGDSFCTSLVPFAALQPGGTVNVTHQYCSCTGFGWGEADLEAIEELLLS